MNSYFIRRFLSLIPVLFIVSIVIFSIVHITPGDPASVILGDEATAEQIADLRNELGLDEPLIHQYLNWLFSALKGDLGTSYFMNQTVIQAILNYIGPTLSLALTAQVIAIVIAIPIGILAATRRGSMIDQTLMGFSLFGISVPSFLLSLFLILIFAVKLRWLPSSGYQPLSAGIWNHYKFIMMPAFALGLMQAALIARMTRSSMLGILNSNYIKTARSKGLKEYRVIYKHALRNAFIPILTVIGQTFGTLVSGAAVVETIFNIPGIGQLIINSVERRDYAIIQGVVLFVTCFYVFINLLIDLLYGLIDPRVRLHNKK